MSAAAQLSFDQPTERQRLDADVIEAALRWYGYRRGVRPQVTSAARLYDATEALHDHQNRAGR